MTFEGNPVTVKNKKLTFVLDSFSSLEIFKYKVTIEIGKKTC